MRDLRQRLSQLPAAWLVARAEHAELAARAGSIEAETRDFVLIRVNPEARP
jgi:hypothetical protein